MPPFEAPPAAPIPAPAAPAPTPAAASAPEPTPGDPAATPPPTPGNGEDDNHTLPKGVQRRIDRAVRQRYEAEARAQVAMEESARMRAQLEAMNQGGRGPQSGQPTQDTVPTIDKFDNIEDYVSAKAKWIARAEIQAAMEEQRETSQRRQDEQAAATLHSTWQERVAAASATLPDFLDVVSASEVPLTPAMERAVMESEAGPKLAYWLAQNPAEAIKIAQMTPTRAFAALGRLEERLLTAPAPAPVVSNAPAPIVPAGSRAAVVQNPDDLTAEQWMAWRRDQLKS